MTTDERRSELEGHIERRKKDTTEQRIMDLEDGSRAAIVWAGGIESESAALVAIAYELRALRLMLKDELRELGWKVQPPDSLDDGYGGRRTVG